ncbi:MAG TPA: class I SAM-dependent methyltransferase [Candidatus Limnocylindria bacterium]|nr:class I SAM-dependent methyltransferase [Candidatus Limnocylindria bacterium]
MRFFDRPSTVRRAREAFDRAGYKLDAITERLGPHAFAHLAGGELAPLVRATRGGDRLDALLRLFLIGRPVPLGAARAALAPLPLEQWTAGGVLGVDGAEARGRIAIRPLEGPDGWLVAHDFTRAGDVAVDHVLGVSASTMALAGATIRRPIDAAFDLGTGCGVQALHASSHSARVVASDVNPRAVACARLTVELNGLDNVEVRLGDRFEPVEDERFDLVVANPPFVVSPSRRYTFRDSDLPLDDLSRTIVQRAAAHLRDGGHGQLLASWVHVEGEDWRDRLAGWFDGLGCDALVLEREALGPSAHAASWLRQTEPPERWQDEYDEWMSYYEAHHVEAIGLGLITMRRRVGGDPWFRAEEAPQDFAMPCGDHLGAAFELADFLDVHPNERLLGVAMRVAPDVVLDERARPTPGGWSVSDRRLRQTAGLRQEGRVDAAVAAIVAACDGRRPLGAVLGEAASVAGMEAAALAEGALPLIRRLIARAFLLPVIE